MFRLDHDESFRSQYVGIGGASKRIQDGLLNACQDFGQRTARKRMRASFETGV